MHSTLTYKDPNMAKISKNMTFNEVLRKYPDSVKVLKKYGMNCFGCLGAEAESLEYGAIAHGVDLDSLLKDLNKVLKN
jgi:hybrid cluster-associated redox disulfide protein